MFDFPIIFISAVHYLTILIYLYYGLYGTTACGLQYNPCPKDVKNHLNCKELHYN